MTDQTINSQDWPRTKEDAVQYLLKIIPTDAKETVRGMSDYDLYSLHHTVGRWIRNNFGLWEENEDLRVACGYKDQPIHDAADGSSHAILLALRDALVAEQKEQN